MSRHTQIVVASLLGLTAVWLACGLPAASGCGAGLVLIGGAVIGVPHGSSDFLVAHRLLKPKLGPLWLPALVLGYLALVLGVVAAWAFAPFATLLVFLPISGLHFGKQDLASHDGPTSWLRWAAHASTPLVPVVMLHLPDVAPFFATMTSREAGSIILAFEPFRMPILAAWVATVAATVLAELQSTGAARLGRGAGACELVALSVAAALLPPLLTFAAYFCLVHAVRHMVDLTAHVHPNDGGRAIRLAALIIGPSAVVCLVALTASWSTLAGKSATDTLLCAALQLVAALTVPHMALELLDHGPVPMPRQELGRDTTGALP